MPRFPGSRIAGAGLGRQSEQNQRTKTLEQRAATGGEVGAGERRGFAGQSESRDLQQFAVATDRYPHGLREHAAFAGTLQALDDRQPAAAVGERRQFALG